MLRILFLLLLAISNPAFAEPLVLLNWADYIDPEVLTEFSKQTGIEVKEVYYDSDEGRDEVMASSNGKGYDLIMMNGVAINNYQKQGWLEAIPSPAPKNLSLIDSRWKEAFIASNEYGVPYFWGTIGIAYRKDLLKDPIHSWQQIFSPKEELKGKINMMNSAREVVAASLKSLGYSSNSANKSEFKAALKRMHEQSEYVNTYIGVTLDKSSALLSGKSLAAMMYSGDALMLQDLSDNIKYILPTEGSNIWVDFLTVSSVSKQKENAWKFINFINQPKVAAQIANFVYCASPNKGARELLDDEFLSNQTIFPSKTTLEKSEFYKPLPPRSLKKLTKNFQQLVK